MVFVLRVSARDSGDLSPRRVLRETDEDGTERTFWLLDCAGPRAAGHSLDRGRWVVATRTDDGYLGCTSASGVRATLTQAGSVTFVDVSLQDALDARRDTPLDQPPRLSIPD